METRLIVAYALIALLLVVTVAGTIVFRRRKRENDFILSGRTRREANAATPKSSQGGKQP